MPHYRYEASLHHRSRSIFSAFYVLFIESFGYVFLFPLFPTLLLHPTFGILPTIESEGGRNLFLGLLLIASPFGQIFGALFFGNFADRYGRKQTLIWTLTGTILGYLLSALGVKAKLYSLILFSRLFTGFFSASLVICMAILADLYIGKKERAKSLSLVSAALGITWVGAIILGSFITTPEKLKFLDPSLPFWIVALLSLSSLLILLKLYTETYPHEQKQSLSILKGVKSIAHILEYKQLRVLYFTLFFWFFGLFISLQWAAPVSIEKFKTTEGALAWFFIALGIFWALSSGLLNRSIIERASLWKITIWGLFLVSLLLFFASVADFFFYFAATYLLSGIFSAICWGNLMSLVSITSTPENQGKSLGIALSTLALAQGLGPLFGGIVAGFSIELIFFACAFLVFIAFLFLLIYVFQRMGKQLN